MLGGRHLDAEHLDAPRLGPRLKREHKIIIVKIKVLFHINERR